MTMSQDAHTIDFAKASMARLAIATPTQFSPEKIKEEVAALEVPFDPSQIEWQVMNTTKNGQPMRPQVVPYANQRAYTDRLNCLFTRLDGSGSISFAAQQWCSCF